LQEVNGLCETLTLLEALAAPTVGASIFSAAGAASGNVAASWLDPLKLHWVLLIIDNNHLITFHKSRESAGPAAVVHSLNYLSARGGKAHYRPDNNNSTPHNFIAHHHALSLTPMLPQSRAFSQTLHNGPYEHYSNKGSPTDEKDEKPVHQLYNYFFTNT
jgi:hypothetical protein